MAIFRNKNIFGDIFFYCIFVVTYCHLCPPPPHPQPPRAARRRRPCPRIRWPSLPLRRCRPPGCGRPRRRCLIYYTAGSETVFVFLLSSIV